RYQRVAYLECVLGQSSFTPGRMVSLNIISSPILGQFPAIISFDQYLFCPQDHHSPSYGNLFRRIILAVPHLAQLLPIIFPGPPPWCRNIG
ncbi:hypothetical protein M422DRAFT_171270, partial [Sphaerobolus stellatus SS14]